MDTLLRETVNAVVNSRFPEMSIEGRRQIESILIREEFPKGAIALNEGEVAHEIVFVGKGMLRQYYYKNGKDVTEHFSYEGCIVMCIESFLKQVPTRLIVETLEPSIIYLFPRDMIQKLARENWEINMFYQKILEYSLIVSQVKADSWRFESARERYNLLLETHPEIIKRAPLAHSLLPADDTGDLEPRTLRSSVNTLSVLPIFFGRHPRIMLKIFPEEGLVGKAQAVSYLLYIHA